jgi:drug/metabolite transporter (DMT)-like permease
VLAMTLWIAAFKLTNINIAAILNQTNTIFIIILASVFLNEKFTLRKLIATILAFSGSIIVILY